MAKNDRRISILLAVKEEITKVFPRISRAIDAVKRDLVELKTPAGVVRVAFRNMRRAGRGVIQSFRRIRSSARLLRRSLISVKTVVGTLFAAFVTGRGIRALLDTVEQLDTLAKTADKLGILPERLTELRFAAEQTGIAVNTFDLGLQRMVRRVAEAATGTGEAQGALRDLGLDAAELAAQSPDEIFLAIAEAMKDIEGEGKRVALAFKLFDSEGVALKNTLSLTADEFERLFAQAEALGLLFARDQLRTVEKLADAVNRLRRAWQGLRQMLAVSLAPVLTGLVDDLTLVVVLLPKLFKSLRDTISKAFEVGEQGDEARKKIKELLASIVALFATAAIEAATVFAVTLQEALILAVRVIGPELGEAISSAIHQATEGKFGKLSGAELRASLEKQLPALRKNLALAEVGLFEPTGTGLTGGIANMLGDFSPEAFRERIAKVEAELEGFDEREALRTRERQLAFGQQLEALVTTVGTFASEGNTAVSESAARLSDALSEITDFKKLADPEFVKTLREEAAGLRKQLDESTDLDADQKQNLADVVLSLEKVIELREAQVAGDERRAAILQQEISHTAELTQLRDQLIKSGEAQGEQAQTLIDRLTELQAAERKSLAGRLAAQEQLDLVLEAEQELSRAIQDREAAVALGVISQQAAATATDAQAEALRGLATAARDTIAALGGGLELQEFTRQLDDVVARLRTIAGETGGIFAGIRAGISDFVSEASNQFRQWQSLTLDILGTIRSGFAGVFSGVIRGTQDVGQAFEEMLFRMLDRVIVFLTDQVILQFLQLFTAEGVLGSAFQQLTTAIGIGGVGQAATGGAAAGVAAITGAAVEEGAEAVTESANTLALGVNTTALGVNTTALGVLGGTAIGGAITALGGIATGLGTTVGGAATVIEAAAAVMVKTISANTVAVLANTKAVTVETVTPLLAAGGFVPGPRVQADIVPARLTPGEYVLRQRAAAYYGGGILEALNRRLVPRELFDKFRANVSLAAPVGMFQAGGSVQPTATPTTGLVPAVVVADDGTMDRLLAGGENSLMRWFEDRGPQIASLIDRHRGLPG